MTPKGFPSFHQWEAEFGGLNLVRGVVPLASSLPHQTIRRQGPLAVASLSSAPHWLIHSSPHLLSRTTVLWDVTVATSNLPPKLFLASGEFHSPSLSWVSDLTTTLITSLLQATREMGLPNHDSIHLVMNEQSSSSQPTPQTSLKPQSMSKTWRVSPVLLCMQYCPFI